MSLVCARRNTSTGEAGEGALGHPLLPFSSPCSETPSQRYRKHSGHRCIPGWTGIIPESLVQTQLLQKSSQTAATGSDNISSPTLSPALNPSCWPAMERGELTRQSNWYLKSILWASKITHHKMGRQLLKVWLKKKKKKKKSLNSHAIMSQLQRAGGLDEPGTDVCSPVLRRGAVRMDGAALLGCFPSRAPGATRTAPSWLRQEPPLSPR